MSDSFIEFKDYSSSRPLLGPRPVRIKALVISVLSIEKHPHIDDCQFNQGLAHSKRLTSNVMQENQY